MTDESIQKWNINIGIQLQDNKYNYTYVNFDPPLTPLNYNSILEACYEVCKRLAISNLGKTG